MEVIKTSKSSILQNFIDMCHILYDNLHGKHRVKTIFYPISEAQLTELIQIYNTSSVYLRWKNIGQYIAKTSNLNCDGATDFYVNAIQHYLYKDY